MGTVTPKLDLEEDVVVKAKQAIMMQQKLDPADTDLSDISFSGTAKTAMDKYGDHIREHLEAAGFRRQNVVRGRPRRLPDELWNELKEMSDEYDASRISILRAALALLGAEVSDDSPGNGRKRRKRK